MKKGKAFYVSTTWASIAFAVLLTFGFIWTSTHKEAPFTTYMEGLLLALGVITGKRLFQTWSGKHAKFEKKEDQ